jgi:hypothetical protein
MCKQRASANTEHPTKTIPTTKKKKSHNKDNTNSYHTHKSKYQQKYPSTARKINNESKKNVIKIHMLMCPSTSSK